MEVDTDTTPVTSPTTVAPAVTAATTTKQTLIEQRQQQEKEGNSNDDEMCNEIKALRAQLATQERNNNKSNTSNDDEMYNRLAALESKLSILEQNNTNNNDEIHRKMFDLQAKISILESKSNSSSTTTTITSTIATSDGMYSKMAALQSKVATLEETVKDLKATISDLGNGGGRNGAMNWKTSDSVRRIGQAGRNNNIVNAKVDEVATTSDVQWVPPDYRTMMQQPPPMTAGEYEEIFKNGNKSTPTTYVPSPRSQHHLPYITTLCSKPTSLYEVWEEWQNGLNGRKPARLFTKQERGRIRSLFSKRKVIWDCIGDMVKRGVDPNEAIARIYMVYGGKKGKRGSVSGIMNRMTEDRKAGKVHRLFEV